MTDTKAKVVGINGNMVTIEFDGNIDNMVAAYNAGPTNVSNWLAQKDFSADGENLINIPFEETRKYSEKVNYAYEMYLKIYGGA